MTNLLFLQKFCSSVKRECLQYYSSITLLIHLKNHTHFPDTNMNHKVHSHVLWEYFAHWRWLTEVKYS